MPRIVELKMLLANFRCELFHCYTWFLIRSSAADAASMPGISQPFPNIFDPANLLGDTGASNTKIRCVGRFLCPHRRSASVILYAHTQDARTVYSRGAVAWQSRKS